MNDPTHPYHGPRSVLHGALFAALVASGANVFALPQPTVDGSAQADAALENIDVVERLGQKIPRDIRIVTDDGRAVTLGEVFAQGKPVIMTLAYYRCPMLCNLVANGVSDIIAKTTLVPGKDFTILTVSINPEETPELAAAKKANYLKELSGKRSDIAPASWIFATAEGEQSRVLADAVGFKYYFIPEKNEFAHAAVMFVLSSDGTISRYWYGIEFDERNVRLSLVEAAEGKIGATTDRLLLYCLRYDPDAQGYTVVVSRIMRLGGALTVIALGAFLTYMWTRDRRRRTQNTVTRAA